MRLSARPRLQVLGPHKASPNTVSWKPPLALHVSESLTRPVYFIPSLQLHYAGTQQRRLTYNTLASSVQALTVKFPKSEQSWLTPCHRQYSLPFRYRGNSAGPWENSDRLCLKSSETRDAWDARPSSCIRNNPLTPQCAQSYWRLTLKLWHSA